MNSLSNRKYNAIYIKNHGLQNKNRSFTDALNLGSLILLLAAFILVTAFQSIQIEKLIIHTKSIQKDINTLKTEHNMIIEKYPSFFEEHFV